MPYLKNRKFQKSNLALFSICEKIGLKVSARQRRQGNGSFKLCLEVFFPPKNEYIALAEKIRKDELGDAIFIAYLKYYTYLTKYGTIKNIKDTAIKEEERISIPKDHKCKYIKRMGEPCSLINNCKYPNCNKKGIEEQSMKFEFKM